MDSEDFIPTLVDETNVLSPKIPVTILTGYLGMFFFQYLQIIISFFS